MIRRKEIYNDEGERSRLITTENGDQFMEKTDGTTVALATWQEAPSTRLVAS